MENTVAEVVGWSLLKVVSFSLRGKSSGMRQSRRLLGSIGLIE